MYHRLRLRTRAAAKRKIPQVRNIPNHISLQHFWCHLSPQLILLLQMQSDHECVYQHYKIYCYYLEIYSRPYLLTVTAYNTWLFCTLKYCTIIIVLLYHHYCIIIDVLLYYKIVLHNTFALYLSGECHPNSNNCQQHKEEGHKGIS